MKLVSLHWLVVGMMMVVVAVVAALAALAVANGELNYCSPTVVRAPVANVGVTG